MDIRESPGCIRNGVGKVTRHYQCLLLGHYGSSPRSANGASLNHKFDALCGYQTLCWPSGSRCHSGRVMGIGHVLSYLSPPFCNKSSYLHHFHLYSKHVVGCILNLYMGTAGKVALSRRKKWPNFGTVVNAINLRCYQQTT